MSDVQDEVRRYLADVDELARMASIVWDMTAFGFDFDRARTTNVEGQVSFFFEKERVEDIVFAVRNIKARVNSLSGRRQILETAAGVDDD